MAGVSRVVAAVAALVAVFAILLPIAQAQAPAPAPTSDGINQNSLSTFFCTCFFLAF